MFTNLRSSTATSEALWEKLHFLAKFIRSPRSVGSVTPSSRFLMQKMMKRIKWEQVRTIAELGAGTGVFTRAIHQLSHPDTQVIVFEHDSEMRASVEAEFPMLHHRRDALELTSVVQELGLPNLDCIISGLPLTLFPREVRDQLMDEVVNALKPGGIYIQFQYSLYLLPELRRRFSQVEVDFVPLNAPPAFVYACHK